MEIFQSIKDDALKRCPQCGSRKFRKMVSSGAGIIFKGDGFWETDYNRSQDYHTQSKAERGTAASADASSGSGSDTGKGQSAASSSASPATASSKGSQP
ncbi:MAG: zinc ribbon domain-containing protein [Planctomycetota bacterium]|nr:MAG: zinc ribbon domain-containing protein [Planctomycetota bacterium]